MHALQKICLKSLETTFLFSFSCALCAIGQFLCSALFFMCKQFARSSQLNSGRDEEGITYKIWKSFYLLTTRCSSERTILILSAYRKRMACCRSIDLRNFANYLWPSSVCCPAGEIKKGTNIKKERKSNKNLVFLPDNSNESLIELC